jgi:hypothetical protein
MIALKVTISMCFSIKINCPEKVQLAWGFKPFMLRASGSVELDSHHVTIFILYINKYV